jgi:hypothetical protein
VEPAAVLRTARAWGVVKKLFPIPALSAATRHELDEVCETVVGSTFEALLERCRRADADARGAGGLQGWRPSGPGTLPIRIALEVALADDEVAHG